LAFIYSYPADVFPNPSKPFMSRFDQIRDSFRRNARRCVDRLQNLKLAKWLSEQESAVCVSILSPTSLALQTGLPEVAKYRGLQAVMEVKNPQGNIEWHLLWRTEHAADRSEWRFAQTHGIGPAARYSVRDIKLQREKWWKRVLPWGFIAASTIGGVAAIITNWGTIDDSRLQIMHKPEMSLESHEMIKLASHSKESKEIVLRGDPYFRARLEGLSMKIEPDPKYSNGQQLPNGGNYEIPASPRSVDVSGELKVNLPFEMLPPGRYLVYLRGKVQTKGNSGELQLPQGALELDVRDKVAARRTQVTPWQNPPSSIVSKTSEALVDFTLLFGRLHNKTSNLRLVLAGEWTSWSMDDPPQGTAIDRESQNSSEHPKGIVFVLRNVPSEEFGSLSLRIHVQAPTPHTNDEWNKIVPEPMVEATDAE
jgi:hypothetical protein